MSTPTQETTATEIVEPQVEVVDRASVEIPAPADAPLVGELVKQDPRDAAVHAAADAALAMPGAPGRDEFLTIAAQARMISMSGAAPKLVQGNPFIAFHVAMIGRDLGISVSAAIELIDVINTSAGPRISLSPQLINGQIRRLGLGSIRPIRRDEFECVAGAYGPDDKLLGEAEFTWEDARTAGIVAEGCEPGKHTPKCRDRQSSSSQRCNNGYVTYPKRMLWWRAAGFAADDFFPEAGLGLYTPEALGAIVDVDGRPIDPANVELPDGYAPPPRSTTEQRNTTRADLDELWALQERVFSLPVEQQAELRERWQQSDKLRGVPVRALPEGKIQLAKSMINGFASIAKRSGWDADAALVSVHEQESWRVCSLIASSIVGRWVTLDTGSAPQPPADDSTDVAGEPATEPAERSDADPGTSDTPDRPGSAEAALAAAPDHVVAAVIERVQSMSPTQITDELRGRKLAMMGNPAARAKRLAEALVVEAMYVPPTEG